MMQTKYIGAALYLALLVVTFSTVHASQEVEAHFSHFSFDQPDQNDWKNQEFGTRKAVYSSKRGSNYHQIVLMENFIRDEAMKLMGIPSIANHYRNTEKRNMIELGVNRGLYELLNLTMGEDTVGEKTFYTMKYSTKQKKAFTNAQLYLFFPGTKKVTNFFLALYVQTAPSKKKLKKSLEKDFFGVLETVKVRGND
jgi:hypothetical protein